MNQNEENAALTLDDMERDVIGEILNISMGSAATAISTMLDKKVVITTPQVFTQTVESIDYAELEPAICIEITYVEGISGNNVMVFRQNDIRLILDQLMGRDSSEDEAFEFDEMSISAACEVMNQMMGASATALSNFLNRKIDISPPKAYVIDDIDIRENIGIPMQDTVTVIKFNLEIEGIMNSEFISVMSMSLAKEIIGQSMQFPQEEVVEVKTTPTPTPPPMQQTPPPMQQQALGGYPPPGYGAVPPNYYGQPMMPPPNNYQPQSIVRPQSDVNVQNVVYENLDGYGAMEGLYNSKNLDLILSVPLRVSIEIGQTKKKIKEILDFTQGTVIELDKQAGAPVDVIVNGKLIARGDVVVIDDNFAVRITEILQKREILENI
ncbi:MAG: flagellar motor switch phosphatase FliY [Oscillospiraceae bacterium]